LRFQLLNGGVCKCHVRLSPKMCAHDENGCSPRSTRYQCIHVRFIWKEIHQNDMDLTHIGPKKWAHMRPSWAHHFCHWAHIWAHETVDLVGTVWIVPELK
jgi:hypothetical protein